MHSEILVIYFIHVAIYVDIYTHTFQLKSHTLCKRIGLQINATSVTSPGTKGIVIYVH